ncbi:FadR/GntR family transcriptional regulator [Streptomyces sp. NPDC090075]|uniref:FadR/GntR family transcriptional regulator n=1 Tax=Streptomyces sp. NPDC090075 TaxID=3365937 RepID=UPI0037F4B4E3
MATASELALEEIRTALALGRFALGDALPKERDLAEMLSVSRVTVRAALAVLAAEGVIEVRRGRGGGSFVTEGAVETVSAQNRRAQSREELRQTFEYRSILEASAAELAAKRRSATHLARLRELVDEMQRLVEEPAPDPHFIVELLALDHEFHIGIARAADNRRLADAVQAARAEMFRPIGSVFSRHDPHFNDTHAQILDAIEERDGTRAGRLMAAHVQDSLARLEALLARQH